MLSPQQEKEVRLQVLKCKIRYYEVYLELADHYLSAVQARIQEGVSFSEALQQTHTDFGGNKGLKALEQSYRSNALRYYRKLHWHEFINRFGIPQFLIILIAAAAGWGLGELMSAKAFIATLFIMSFLSFSFVSFIGSSSNDLLWTKHISFPKTLRGHALSMQALVAVSLLYFLFFGSIFILGNQQANSFFENLQTPLLSSLLALYFVYFWSLFRTVKLTKPQLT